MRLSARARLRVFALIAFLTCFAPGAPAEQVEDGPWLLVTAGEAVSVFAGPGTGYGVLAVVNPGDRVRLCGKRQIWYIVCLDNGKEGFLYERWAKKHTGDEPTMDELLTDAAHKRRTLTAEKEAAGRRVLTEPGSPGQPGRSAVYRANRESQTEQQREAARRDAERIVEQINEGRSPKADTPAAEEPASEDEVIVIDEEPEPPENRPGGVIAALAHKARTAPDHLDRLRATRALRKHGNAAIPELVELLDASSELVRSEAARALGTIGGKRAEKALMKTLSDAASTDTVKAAVAEALANLDVKSALPALRSELDNTNNPYYRDALEQAIARLGD